MVTTFAYEIIFSAPMQKLFAGYYEAVRRDVHARAYQLMKALATEVKDPRAARKIAFLRTIVDTNPLRSDRDAR